MLIEKIIEPALTLAWDGIEMTKLQAYFFSVVGGIYVSTAASRAIFGSKEVFSHLPGEGERISNPAYADILEVYSIGGEDLFYRGAFAAHIL